MATAAFNAQGTIVTLNGTEIAEVTEFGGPGIEKPRTQATHLRSTAHEYISGIQDNGEFTLTVNYLPGDPGQLLLRSLMASGATGTIVVSLPDDPATSNPRETWTFDVVVTGVEPDPGEVFRNEWTMAVSGSIAYAVPT